MLKILKKFLLISIITLSVVNISSAEDSQTTNLEWMQYNNPYTSDGLDIAHITGNEAVTWAQNTISEIFTLTPQDYAARLTTFKTKDFSQSGWLKYAQFLRDSGIITSITNDNQSIAAIVPETPLIIDEKIIDEKFRWIVKMKAGISFFIMTDRGEKRTLKSGDYIVYLDITRVPKTDSSNELAIVINDIRLTPNIEGQ